MGIGQRWKASLGDTGHRPVASQRHPTVWLFVYDRRKERRRKRKKKVKEIQDQRKQHMGAVGCIAARAWTAAAEGEEGRNISMLTWSAHDCIRGRWWSAQRMQTPGTHHRVARRLDWWGRRATGVRAKQHRYPENIIDNHSYSSLSIVSRHHNSPNGTMLLPRYLRCIYVRCILFASHLLCMSSQVRMPGETVHNHNCPRAASRHQAIVCM